MNRTERLVSRINEFMTFEDILQLALAQTGTTQFTADSHKWSAALHQVCDRFAGDVPELAVISFTERPPLPPQSDEAYQLITTLAKSGRIGLPNPRLHKIVMSKTEKARITQSKGAVQAKYGDIIKEIAAILEERLQKE